MYPLSVLSECSFLYFFDRKNEEGAKFIDESMSDIDAGKKIQISSIL